MTEIQKKALNHALGLLNQYNSTKVYMALHNVLEKVELDRRVKDDILSEVSKMQSNGDEPIREAKSWIETLLKDVKN